MFYNEGQERKPITVIHVLTSLPRSLVVACSGGVDSMAVVDFLRRCHQVTVAFFDHGTAASQEGKRLLTEWCGQKELELVVGKLDGTKPKDQSWEEYWRLQRYRFFDSLGTVIVTAHHLDDAVETYLFNCLHGKSHTIPLWRNQVVRPFLTTPKREFRSWCERKSVPWVEDSSNQDLKYMRNRIRHCIVPEALQVNPGLGKVVKKMILGQIDHSI